MLWWSLLVIGAALSLPSSTDAVDCSRSFVGNTGVLSSYNFPFDYRHNLSCTYRIVLGPPDGPRTVCFTFRRFALERSTPFCSYDYLRFENTKYCGGGLWQYGVQTSSPESSVWHKHFCWPAKKNHFDVTFQSDNNLNGGGFYAEYRVLQGPPPDYTNDVIDPEHAPCAPHQWTCFNRKCVNMSALCNGEDNCGDGSDESYADARCPEKSVISCDFSSDSVPSDGQCGFVQQDGQWFRTNTKASPFGPRADHTNGTEGYYMYTDSDHSPAYLVSPEINLGSTAGVSCLSFWYYVYGRPAAAILRVYLGRVVTYTNPEWERKSAQPNMWLKGEVTIPTDRPLQVTFGAVLGNSFSGIALDDISVTGECSGGDIACNFESTLCGWKTTSHVVDLHGNLTWHRHNRLQYSAGPLEDHSSSDGGGSYLLVRADPSRPTLDSRALFVSPFVSAFSRTTRCLRFWYHMSGSGSESAVLRTRLLLANGRLTGARWSENARFQNGWRQMVLQLVEDQPFQIILEGILDGATGQIAVDEIQLENGACPEVDSGACAGGEFLCGDGSCIPSIHKCDGITHCQDGSDEDWRAACPKTTTTAKPTVCPRDYFQCVSDGRCIAITWLCDNFRDCDDGSDESHLANCDGVSATPLLSPTTLSPCGAGRFACHNGECIASSARCDNAKDCSDGSDEGTAANCTGQQTTPFSFCGASMFTCDTGRECISIDLVCDGKAHCADGSDEDSTSAQCAKPIDTQGIGTTGAVGIALAILAIITIIILNVVLCRRHKNRQRQEPTAPRSNTPDTNTPDISTISYGDDASLSRPLEDSLRCSAYRPIRRDGSRVMSPVNELQQRIEQMDDNSRQSCIENLERYMIHPRRVQPLPPVPASRVSPQDIVNPNDYILALRAAPIHPPPYSIRDYQNLQYIPTDEQTEGSDDPSSSGVYSLPPDEPPPPYDGRKEVQEGEPLSRRPTGSQNSLHVQTPLPENSSGCDSRTLRHNNRALSTLPLNHRNLISQTLPHNHNNNESNQIVSSQPVMTFSHSFARLGVPVAQATMSQPTLNSSQVGHSPHGHGYSPRRPSPVQDPQLQNHSPNHVPSRHVPTPTSSQSVHHRSFPSNSSNASLSSLTPLAPQQPPYHHHQQQQQQRRSPSHHSNHSHHDSISSQSNMSHQSHPSSHGLSSRVGSPVQSHQPSPIRPSPQLHQVQLQYLPSSSV